MKRITILLLVALTLAVSFAFAEGAPAIQAGTGVSVISAADWADEYPDIYASYMNNSENDAVIDHVTEYPMIAKVYEGMAFNQYYNSARGHVYTIEDITSTGRPHKLANCFTCKTPDFTAMVNDEGVSAYTKPFEDVLSLVNEPISCYNCHANAPGEITVTHSYVPAAMGEDMAKLSPSVAACAQCHVEYYFDPETKATTLPYEGLSSIGPDAIYEYYKDMDFADYTNPRTGVRQIKVQHPEFETFMGEGSVHAGTFSCADCHMGKAQNASGETYVNHKWVSPLDSAEISANCAACHSDLTGFVRGIQDAAEERTISIGNKLEELTDKLADGVAAGKYGEEQLAELLELNRQGQFYWDFVFVENSEGAHNSKLTNKCLDKAEELIDQALAKV